MLTTVNLTESLIENDTFTASPLHSAVANRNDIETNNGHEHLTVTRTAEQTGLFAAAKATLDWMDPDHILYSASPMITVEVAKVLINFLDGAMLSSESPSDDSSAAAGIIFPMVVAYCVAFSAFVFILVPQLIHGDKAKQNETIVFGLALSALAGAGISVASNFTGDLFSAFGTSESITKIVDEFFHSFAYAPVAVFLSLASQQICYGTNNYKTLFIGSGITATSALTWSYLFTIQFPNALPFSHPAIIGQSYSVGYGLSVLYYLTNFYMKNFFAGLTVGKLINDAHTSCALKNFDETNLGALKTITSDAANRALSDKYIKKNTLTKLQSNAPQQEFFNFLETYHLSNFLSKANNTELGPHLTYSIPMETLRYGLPIVGQISLELLAVNFLSFLIVANMDCSTSDLAMLNVLNSYNLFTVIIAIALGSTGSQALSTKIRDRQYDQIRSYGNRLLFTSTIHNLMYILLGLVIPTQLASLFVNTSDITSDGINGNLRIMLTLAFTGLLFNSFRDVISGLLRAYNITNTPMYASFATLWGIGIPLAYVLAVACKMGVAGLILGYYTGTTLGAAYLSCIWAHVSQPQVAKELLNNKGKLAELDTFVGQAKILSQVTGAFFNRTCERLSNLDCRTQLGQN